MNVSSFFFNILVLVYLIRRSNTRGSRRVFLFIAYRPFYFCVYGIYPLYFSVYDRYSLYFLAYKIFKICILT